MLLLIAFSFLAGVTTIIAPCVWPILNIIFSSSLQNKSKSRPLGITLGIILSFSVFTLSISYLVSLFHINPNIFRLFSTAVIAVLGLCMLIPTFSLFLESLISKLSSRFGSAPQKNGSGFSGGFITGLSLGIIWSPCAGPILAAIALLASTRAVTYSAVFVTLSYALGAGIPLFLFSLGSQKLLAKTRFLSPYTGIIQKIFGVVMILTAFAIYNNYDQVLSVDLLNAFPSLSAASNSFETNQAVSSTLNSLKGQANQAPLENQGQAPDFIGITNWLNTSAPISIKDLRGKVVLVDFWTYTCINCIRTLPFVTSWYDKYHTQGFVVVGIHTPEFEFEKDTGNVESAIKRFNIHYPVAQDNNYATWNNYNNQYWPAEYLIDSQGNIRETNFGEGNYAQTEEHIQQLLKEAGQSSVSAGLVNMSDQTPTDQNLSPETYLGSNKAQYFYPDQTLNNQTKQFTLSPNLPVDSFDLGGEWYIEPNVAVSGNSAVLEYNFHAGKVFLVLQPPDMKQGTIRVFLDGKALTGQDAGTDVKNGVVTVDSDRLYNLINLKGSSGAHLLHLEFQTPGVRADAFTFG